jgi:hypothetical protein
VPDYKYTYFQFKGDPEINIKTDFGIEFSDIKQNLIEQTPERIIRESIYPNGFAVKIEQTADSVVFYTNKELIKDTDGSYYPKI